MEEGKEEMDKGVEGEGKVKRKMKTASQLELLENTYASKFVYLLVCFIFMFLCTHLC